MPKLTERRRARRHLTETELIVFYRGVPQTARLLDVSERGARLDTAEYLHARTPLVLVFSAVGLTLTARVRFQRAGSGTGLEFTRLTPRDRRRLAELIPTLALR